MNFKVKTKLLVMVTVAILVLVCVVWSSLSRMSTLAGNEKEASISTRQVEILAGLKNKLQAIRLDLV